MMIRLHIQKQWWDLQQYIPLKQDWTKICIIHKQYSTSLKKKESSTHHTDSLLPSYIANFVLSLQEFMKTEWLKGQCLTNNDLTGILNWPAWILQWQELLRTTIVFNKIIFFKNKEKEKLSLHHNGISYLDMNTQPMHLQI